MLFASAAPRARRRAATTLACLIVGASLLACRREPPPPPPPAAIAPPKPHYGAVMMEVAQRWSLLGRAGLAKQWELADYEADELGEVFEEDLARADEPKEGHPEVLPQMASDFAKFRLPELRKAIDAKDAATFAASFGKIADACNACHEASGHAFIVIGKEPGREVPSLEVGSPAGSAAVEPTAPKPSATAGDLLGPRR